MELAEKKSHRMQNYDPDNPSQGLIHRCPDHARRHLNPIIDWSTDEVWEFIHEYNIPYCPLYDEGYKRLGCIGCPMGGTAQRMHEFERWPKYKDAYIRAFDRMIKIRQGGGTDKLQKQERNNSKDISESHKDGCGDVRSMDHEHHRAVLEVIDKRIVPVVDWDTGEQVMKWWIK